MPDYTVASQREEIENEMRQAGKVEFEIKERIADQLSSLPDDLTPRYTQTLHLPAHSSDDDHDDEAKYGDDDDDSNEKTDSHIPSHGDWHEARSLSPPPSTFRLPSSLTSSTVLLSVAFAAIRTNLIPGLVLQSFALLLLILYFSSPAVEAVFNSVAAVKDQYGLLFSCITTSIAGGLIPFIILAIQTHRHNSHLQAQSLPIPPRTPPLPLEGVFLCALWAEKGVEVDLFYQLQGVMFGTSNSAAVIVPKVLFDMFVYNPVWATPSILVAFFWKDAGFDWRAAYMKWRSREYWVFILPSNLISVWLVWLPSVSIIYALPGSLQIPLFAIVVCFWSILLQIITKAKKKEGGEGEKGGERIEDVGNEEDEMGDEDEELDEGEDEEGEDKEEEDEGEVEMAEVEGSSTAVER